MNLIYKIIKSINHLLIMNHQQKKHCVIEQILYISYT